MKKNMMMTTMLALGTILTGCDNAEQRAMKSEMRPHLKPLLSDLNDIQHQFHDGIIVMNAQTRDSLELANFYKHAGTLSDSIKEKYQLSIDPLHNDIQIREQSGLKVTLKY
jgi:hypothetical protein